MIQLKKENVESLTYGTYEPFEIDNDYIISYTRKGDKQFNVIVNLSNEKQSIQSLNGKIILNNYDSFDGILLPYQAIMVEI